MEDSVSHIVAKLYGGMNGGDGMGGMGGMGGMDSNAEPSSSPFGARTDPVVDDLD